MPTTHRATSSAVAVGSRFGSDSCGPSSGSSASRRQPPKPLPIGEEPHHLVPTRSDWVRRPRDHEWSRGLSVCGSIRAWPTAASFLVHRPRDRVNPNTVLLGSDQTGCPCPQPGQGTATPKKQNSNDAGAQRQRLLASRGTKPSAQLRAWTLLRFSFAACLDDALARAVEPAR